MKNFDILDWFHLHYGQSTFHGRFQIGYRKRNEIVLIPLVTNDRSDLQKFISDMYLRPDYDYYITANSISGVSRKSEGLFSYHNIVIDLDNHIEKQGNDDVFDGIQFQIEELIWRLQRDWDLPSPTSIVKTGRGVQIWWALVPVHMKCKPYLDEVRNFFLEEIERIMEEYPDLKAFSVDRSASCNDVGYFRLPFSTNTKAGKKVQLDYVDPSAVYVLQNLVQAVKEQKASLAQEEELPSTRDKQFAYDFANHEIFVLKNVQTLAFFRIRQLILLRKIRNSEINNETRNNLNFLVYNALLPAMGEAIAWEKLLSYNEGFKIPMKSKELEAVIVSAKDKGGYKYSNDKIIEFLAITPEEQEKIQLFSAKNKSHSPISKFSQHPSRDAARSLWKESRNAEIRELAQGGLCQKEICDKLNLSPATIAKVLGTKENKNHKKNLAIKALEDGRSISDAVKISGLSRSSVKRLLPSIAVPR